MGVALDQRIIKIAIEKTTEDLKSFFLKATTKGGIVVRQEFIVSEEACAFTITPIVDAGNPKMDQNIVLAFKKDEDVNYAKELQTEFSFATGDPT